jgi:4-hydroxybenzoate polyprenyltransferase
VSQKTRIVVLFNIATQALLLSGLFLSKETDVLQIALTSLIGINGTLLIYGFDFGYGAGRNILKYLQNSRQHPWQSLFLVQFFVLTLPLTLCFLTWDRILLMALIGGFGLLYSMHFPFVKEGFRFKRILLLKNCLIGFSWGALVLVGAGTVDNQLADLFFWFMSLQIIVGSIVRDCADTHHDEKLGVRTLPLKFGIKRTIVGIHVANIVTACVLFFFPIALQSIVVISITVIWRSIVIYKVGKNHGSLFWTQTLNILTCLVFFFLILIVSI